MQVNFASNQNILPESFNLSSEYVSGDQNDPTDTDFERWSDFIRNSLIYQASYRFDGLKNALIPTAPPMNNNEEFGGSLKKMLNDSSKKILTSQVPPIKTTQTPISFSSIRPDVRSLGSELITVSKIDKATSELLKGAFGNGFLAKMIEETIVGTVEREVSKSLDKTAKEFFGYLEAKEKVRELLKPKKMVSCQCIKDGKVISTRMVPENMCVSGTPC